MPRKAKRMQTPAAPQEQGYGVRGEQIAAQNTMGIPQNRDAAPLSAGGGAPEVGVGAPTAAPTPPLDPNAVVGALQSLPPPPAGGLARPTERPDEPITTGLGGPAQPTPHNKAAETLEMMAEVTGDPRFSRMAQRARMI